MTTASIVPSPSRPSAQFISSGLTGMFERLGRTALFARLGNLQQGMLTIIDAEGEYVFGRSPAAAPLEATITVREPQFYVDVAFGGTVGVGESYMAGSWLVDDLTSLVRIILRNRHVLTDLESGLAHLTAPLNRLLHGLRKNTKDGSRRNIAAHYDLGNDFYRLFLDATMTYSCAVFERPGVTLEEAQTAKYDRICQKLGLLPGHHVIEIGTGWGGFALHAAKNYGCTVTTTTISKEQFEYARWRVQAEDMQARVQVLCKDYRDLTGTYDRLVSIEMIEAVGHQFLDTFFAKCSSLLTDEAMMALQAITIIDQAYESHIRSPDFIKRYIFPGSFIPAVSAIMGVVARTTDMRLVHLEDLTAHYAMTLKIWRERFLDRIGDVLALGYPESFIRMWDYYLGYCEGGFLERYIGDAQMVFSKPGCRDDHCFPHLKADAA